MQIKTKTFLTLLIIFILGAGFQQIVAVNAATAEQGATVNATDSADAAKDGEDALDKDASETEYDKDEDEVDYEDEDYEEDEDDDYEEEDENDEDEDDEDEDDDDDDDELEAQATPDLTAAEAEVIALAAVPGEVTETELEMEDNRLVYEFEIGDQEVLVDANSGEVISVEIDD